MRKYQKLGTQTYTAIISLTLFNIPLSVVWIYIYIYIWKYSLVFTRQYPSISHETGKFMLYLVPTLISYAMFKPLVRYFQSQSLLIPKLVSSCDTLWIFHIIGIWHHGLITDVFSSNFLYNWYSCPITTQNVLILRK